MYKRKHAYIHQRGKELVGNCQEERHSLKLFIYLSLNIYSIKHKF